MSDKNTQHLHLKAETSDDLEVISGAVQDSIIRVQGIVYNNKSRSLTLGLQRYRHEQDKPSRILSGLRFDSVLSVKSAGIDKTKSDAFLVLLSVSFDETEIPAGQVKLEFAGNGHMVIEVECLEVMLLDTGEPWKAKSVPTHDVSE